MRTTKTFNSFEMPSIDFFLAITQPFNYFLFAQDQISILKKTTLSTDSSRNVHVKRKWDANLTLCFSSSLFSLKQIVSCDEI